jgi:hypothetical protein
MIRFFLQNCLTPCGRGNPISSDNSGLASADEETKEILARKGGGGGNSNQGQGGAGEARGFAGMSEEERKRIASKGGQR